jgi:hypothetical protein
MDIFTHQTAAEALFGYLQQRMGARQNKGRGGEERHKDTKRKIECEQIDIFTHHTAAEALFGNLHQRKGTRQNKERGKEERQKDTKKYRMRKKRHSNPSSRCCGFVGIL